MKFVGVFVPAYYIHRLDEDVRKGTPGTKRSHVIRDIIAKHYGPMPEKKSLEAVLGG